METKTAAQGCDSDDGPGRAQWGWGGGGAGLLSYLSATAPNKQSQPASRGAGGWSNQEYNEAFRSSLTCCIIKRKSKQNHGTESSSSFIGLAQCAAEYHQHCW